METTRFRFFFFFQDTLLYETLEDVSNNTADVRAKELAKIAPRDTQVVVYKNGEQFDVVEAVGKKNKN